MTDLIKELRAWRNRIVAFACKEGDEFLEFDEILSRHEHDKDVEPLACLADRKGCGIEVSGSAFYTDTGHTWEVCVITPSFGTCDSFEGIDYAAAEAKAREYLEGLEDKK